jgi:hypothetical protein
VAERDFLSGEDALWIDEVRRQMVVLRLRALEALRGDRARYPRHRARRRRASRTLTHPYRPAARAGLPLPHVSPGRPGQLAEALHIYGRLCDCLRDQLGASPSPATRDQYEPVLVQT